MPFPDKVLDECDMSLIVLLFLLIVKCRQGLSKQGNEYGPLQEIPDWSYAGQYT